MKQLQSNASSISMVVTPETIKEMYNNINFIYKSGMRDISVSICLDYNWTNSDIKEYESQIEKCSDLYKKSYDNADPLHLSLFDMIIEITMKNENKYDCGACKNEIGISSTGNIFPCSVFINNGKADKTHIIGTLQNGIDLKKIMIYLDPSILDSTACKTCVLLKRCYNKCYASNYRIFGDIRKGVEKYCWINKKIIFESDSILDYFIKTKNKSFYEQYKNILGG
jgi:radical SAM protein with 4Fe4S-binding SPASM domain